MCKNLISDKIALASQWVAPKILDLNSIQKGDMPGDKISIDENHLKKAEKIFPELLKLLVPVFNNQSNQKAVISVHGGSGVGKSETGSLLAYYFNNMNIGSYILSGDNYPHRIPKYNDAERLSVFRESGIKGLVARGEYNSERNDKLKELQESGNDSNSEYFKEFPWLEVYKEEGIKGLKNYLGTNNEIDFSELSNIIAQFKNGTENIMLKRMGREENELWYDSVDFSNTNVLIIEWTHGNNPNLEGVDIPILLNSTPKETLEHRRSRNRDGAIDSSFTMMILEIEQGKLVSQAHNAKIILTKNGDIISFEEYTKLMEE
ncbi:ATP-binding protein [Clostridium grantii]|uniref:Alpha-galactosidase n=1 Tax=Clostridium grantii DSM 8605 TaxID=1121316 RepID=A0A1M5VCY6_9CLOT|nr:ATP-binding protein [Clostridium grantii]SHH73087.1 alpha-galactosidase [Clostridium grantii DSM 8605]